MTLTFWKAMLKPTLGGLNHLKPGDIVLGIGLAMVMCGSHIALPMGEAKALLALPRVAKVILISVMLALYVIVPTAQQAFIYFQF